MSGKRKILAEDLFKMKFPEAPAISPDGKRIIFSLRRMDAGENHYLANLHLVPIGGGPARQLTQGDRLDASPVWSPDGKQIAFVSTREKRCSIWLIPADGGEARRLNKLEGIFSQIAFSPDGKELLFLFRPKKNEKPEEKGKRAAYKHITRLSHKLDGFGYFPPEHQQLWAANARTGRARQLTRGDFDVSHPCWSPDGKQIAYLANPDPEAQHDGSGFHIHVIRADGGRPRQITERSGHKAFIAWAPEGKSILFAGHWGSAGQWIKYPFQLWEVSLKGEVYRNLTPWMDNWPFNFVLSDTVMGEAAVILPYREGGEWRLAFTQNEEGACRVYSIPRGGCARREEARLEFGGELSAYHLNCTRNGHAVVAASRMMDMGDLYTLTLDGSCASRRLSKVNRTFLSGLNLSEPEEHWIKSGKVKVHTWIIKPPGYRRDRKYPTLLQIHGGPMGQYGYCFFHEMHLLAAQGYVVVMSNPRGSSGYGNRWMYSIFGKWGTYDYDDLMAVTNWAVRRPYVDSKRLGVLGGSYGGFMTTWILGHTRRFKAGVTMRQAGNRLTQFGSADYNVNSRHYFGVWPWEKPLAYLKHSPNFHAPKISAPLLIIHSEDDLRCPISQADELFVFLKALGKTTEYIRFEGESHGLSRGGRPQNRLERLRRILDWFERYL